MRLPGALLILVLAGCANGTSHSASASPIALSTAPGNVVIGISALQRGAQIQRLSYTGHWEFVSNRKDGRFEGASARSFHVGDALTLVFRGNRIRLYGVTGPGGGNGTIIVAGQPAHTVSFYSAKKATHRLVFDSGELRGDFQSAGLVVSSAGRERPNGYVNVDEVEILSKQAR